MNNMTDSEKIKKSIRKPRLTKTIIKQSDLLSTGSTLLNLACTGYPDGGFWKSGYFYVVGDSRSGKTFLARTCLAEATINKNFDNYRIIDDDVEGGALMDIKKYFGERLAKRIEPPAIDKNGNSLCSETIEDFYFNLDDALNIGPCIYLLDSQDALGSMYERKKFDEKKKASKKGTEAKGDYGDGKAKIHSSGIRSIIPKLKDTGSILIIIGQTRDNINAEFWEPAKIRSGGKALTFYAMMELWSSVGSAKKKSVKGKDRIIGITSKVKIKKNRSTGRDRVVEFPIYYSVGIDDTGGCVDFLISEGHWKKNRTGIVKAGEFDFEGRRDALIKYIEEENYLSDLKNIVTEVWNEIEVLCEVSRRSRY